MKNLALTTLILMSFSFPSLAVEKTRFEMTPSEKAEQDLVIAWQKKKRIEEEKISNDPFLQIHLGPKDGAGRDGDDE